jgi:hypothetical protein
MDRSHAGLVPELGRHLLAEHVDDLAAELAGIILESVEDYAATDRAELQRSCRRNLVRSLQSLSGDLPRPEDLVDAPEETGRLRAQQGLALDALLQSYRLGGRVLWKGILREARARADEVDSLPLLDVATAVWEVVDEHSSAVTRAYRAEEARLQGRDLRRQHVLLDALLDGRGVDLPVAQEAEQVLGLRAGHAFLVAVAACEPSDPDALRAPQEALALRGCASWWRVRAGIEMGLVEVPADGPEQVLEILRSCTAGRVAVSPSVTGTAGLADAARLAETALATLPPGYVGLVQLSERLPEALLVVAPEVSGRLVQEALGPLLGLRPQERDDLLLTVEHVLRHGGSPTHAAATLFCHRNTVIKRLKRVEQLTGRSLNEPRDRLMLELAVLAVRLPVPVPPIVAPAVAGTVRPPARSAAPGSR